MTAGRAAISGAPNQQRYGSAARGSWRSPRDGLGKTGLERRATFPPGGLRAALSNALHSATIWIMNGLKASSPKKKAGYSPKPFFIGRSEIRTPDPHNPIVNSRAQRIPNFLKLWWSTHHKLLYLLFFDFVILWYLGLVAFQNRPNLVPMVPIFPETNPATTTMPRKGHFADDSTQKRTRCRRISGTPSPGVRRSRVTRGGRKTFVVMTRVLEGGQWKNAATRSGNTKEAVASDAEGLDLKTARDRAEGRSSPPPETDKTRRRCCTYPRREGRGDPPTFFANMRDEFLKRYRTRQRTKPRPRTIVEMRRCISGKRFRTGNTNPSPTSPSKMSRNVLDSILDEGHDAHANKTLTVLKMLFNWAYDHDKITDVPTDRIKPPGAVTPPERTLTMPELVAVWNATYRDAASTYISMATSCAS